MKRRWDDDVVFKNQARGTENRDGKEFVNVCLLPSDCSYGVKLIYFQDLLRSDFHKRFMVCLYIHYYFLRLLIGFAEQICAVESLGILEYPDSSSRVFSLANGSILMLSSKLYQKSIINCQ